MDQDQNQNPDQSELLWVCYLIVSEQTKQTYVGASNDAERRLRTHNTGRGAKRTRGQTWSHVVIVSGFGCKQECLSFEAGWKRLGKRRTRARLAKLNTQLQTSSNSQREMISGNPGGTDYAYSSDTVWNRLLDLLYFVRTFNFVGTKFVMRQNQNQIQVQNHHPELTIWFADIKYVYPFEWPKCICIDVDL